jgi:hypothetical protein
MVSCGMAWPSPSFRASLTALGYNTSCENVSLEAQTLNSTMVIPPEALGGHEVEDETSPP